MKAKNIILTSCAALLCITTALNAQSQPGDNRAYLGVLLDTTPLPDLLIKHLGLLPNQGVRVKNVQRGGPADKAGLERDDIIISFQGEDIIDYEHDKLINEIQKAGVGTEVSLEIIHLGKRKNIKLTLETFDDKVNPKYSKEPEIVHSWRPGKFFRLKPGDNNWIEIEVPFDGKSLELYSYEHSDDGENYRITIEGNPNDEDTKITVSTKDKEYETTIKEIDKLPEKYHNALKEDLEDSRKDSKKKEKTKFSLPSMPDELKKHLRENFDEMKKLPDLFDIKPEDKSFEVKPFFGPGDSMNNRIEKQLDKLQKRIEELEKRLGETPKDSSGEDNKQKTRQQNKFRQPQNKVRT